MTINARTNGKAMSVPGGLAVSGIISMGITLIFSIIMSSMLLSEKVSWDQAGYWILGMLFLSSFLGAKAAIGAIKRQRLAVSVMAGVLYWGILLCITALFFGGNYDAVPETAGVIIAGSGCAAMISLPKRRKRKQQKRK